MADRPDADLSLPPCTPTEHHYSCPRCGKPAIERVMLPCSSCLEASPVCPACDEPRRPQRALPLTMNCGSCQHWLNFGARVGVCTRIVPKALVKVDEPFLDGPHGKLSTPERFSCSLWTPEATP